jgi:hypothetical protein
MRFGEMLHSSSRTGAQNINASEPKIGIFFPVKLWACNLWVMPDSKGLQHALVMDCGGWLIRAGASPSTVKIFFCTNDEGLLQSAGLGLTDFIH